MLPKPSPTLTLRQAVAAYADWHSLRGSSTQHQKDTRQRLLALSQLLPEDASVSDVTREHCISLLRQLQRDGRKPSTQVAYYRVLDAFFHWLIDEGHLAESPMRRVPKPKLPQEQIKPLAEEELQRLLAAPDRSTFVGLRDCLCIALLADTGLRISEALQLRIADVDMRQRSLAVLGKGGKTRTVFFGEAVAGLLRDYLRKRKGAVSEELLFVNSLGEPLWKCTISKRLHSYGAAADIRGKRVSPHTLRHTFAVSWLMGGGDAFSLQRLLGHSTSAMTARYVNFTSADLGRLHRTVSPLDRLKVAPTGTELLVTERRRRLH